MTLSLSQKNTVIPADAGIHDHLMVADSLDFGIRRNEG